MDQPISHPLLERLRKIAPEPAKEPVGNVVTAGPVVHSPQDAVMVAAAWRAVEARLTPEEKRQLAAEREQLAAQHSSNFDRLYRPTPPPPTPLLDRLAKETQAEIDRVRALTEASMTPEERRQLENERKAYHAKYARVLEHGGYEPKPGPMMTELEHRTEKQLRKNCGMSDDEAGTIYMQNRPIDPGHSPGYNPLTGQHWIPSRAQREENDRWARMGNLD